MQQYLGVQEAKCDDKRQLTMEALRALHVPYLHAQAISTAAMPLLGDSEMLVAEDEDSIAGKKDSSVSKFIPPSWPFLERQLLEWQAFHNKTELGRRQFITLRKKKYSEPALRHWEQWLGQLRGVDLTTLEDYPVSPKGLARYLAEA